MSHLRSPRNGKHDRRTLQQPGDGELGNRSGMAGCNFRETFGRGMVGFEQLAGKKRIPGEESDLLLLAIMQGLFVTAVAETVSILDSGDLDQLPAFCNLLDGDFADADVADLALLLHAAKRAKRLLKRSARIDAMELVK